MRHSLPAALCAALLLMACGEVRPPGGAGRLDRRAGVPDRLVVEGSPYEMGWWHGHLLGDRIRARAQAAAGAGPHARGDAARALAEHVDLCVDQALHRLSERLIQELEGMSAATGLAAEALIRPEVAADALRMKLEPPLVEGAAAVARDRGGYQARLLLTGEGAPAFAREALLIHRKPAGHPETVLLARPGSLGGWAAVSSDGRGYVLAEVAIRDKRRLGFGGGRPCPISAREALEGSRDAEGLMAELTGTMGHVGIGFSGHAHHVPPVRAMAGVEVYGVPDPPWVLGDESIVVIGPHGDPDAPEARAFRASVAGTPDLSLEERWLRLEAQVPAGQGVVPRADVSWQPGRATLTWRPGPGDGIREVVLTP